MRSPTLDGMERRKRVLVIDDSEDIRDVYDMLLTHAGYEVASAADAMQGFERARTWRPDVILLDVVMPGMDGLELLLKLRSDLAPPIPPVILCSGFGLTEEEALRRGTVRFLRKPTENGDLLEAIEQALDGQPPPVESVRRQRDRASVACERRLEEASELVARIETHAGMSFAELAVMKRPKIETVAAYIGIPRGAMALVRDRRLEVVSATGDAALDVGYDLGRALPQAFEVLETGSSLLLPDASVHPFSSVSRALGGIRFFAGVPLRVGRVSVGVVCLFDPQAHPVEGDDLVALELFGRRGSDLLLRLADGAAGKLAQYGHGVVVRELFDELLDTELRILDRRGGSMELMVIDLPDLAGLEDALARAPSPTRLIAGVLSPNRVALFKRALDGSARETLAALHADLRATTPPRAVGIVDFPAGGVRGFAGCDLVHVAAIALDRAVERGDDTRRVVIEEERGSP